MKKNIICFAALSTLCFGSYALAANPSSKIMNEHNGFYASVNAGTNLVYLGVFSSEGNASQSGVYGFGYSLDVGYNITKYFAVEAGFMQNYVDFNQYVDKEDRDNDLRQHSNIPYGAMKAVIPIGNRASLIGKLGAMYAMADGKSIVLPYTGIGFGYAVSKHVELVAQYQGAIYGVAGAGLLSGGVTYHFR